MKLDLRILLMLAGSSCLATAAAENLPDPTRPPAMLEAPAEGAAGGEGAASAGRQSIIRRQGGKSAAIINNEYVVLGGRVGDARLVKIGEDSVTLKSASGTETLKLMPAVEKTFGGNAEEKGAPSATPGKKGKK